MAFIRVRAQNGRNYYYLIESKRSSKNNTPRQKSTYLGKYQRACNIIEKLNLPKDVKEGFLLSINKKEDELNPDTYNLP